MKTMKLSLFLTAAASLLVKSANADGHFEWAGAFTLADSMHQWSMQMVGGAYADPSMRMVLYSVANASAAAIESLEAGSEPLITGSACPVIEAGQTINGITAAGSCYELHVGTGPDSLYPMDTTGITGLVIFAQHVPVEFERDMHYLKDSAGTDIEPVAQEGGDGHSHDHGGDDGPKQACGCRAADLGLNIDCTATAAMTDALGMLKSSGCATDCTSDACKKAWFVVQVHHDYCTTDVIPPAIEDDFHDFDETCDSCAIERIFVPGAPDCPVPNCDDQSGNQAYEFLVDNGCSTGCSTDSTCQARFLTLRTVHDGCPHDTLTTRSEEGIHDYEDPCASVICNAVSSTVDQTKCPSSSAVSSTVAVMASAAAIVSATLSML